MRVLAIAALLVAASTAQAQTLELTLNQDARDAGLDEAQLEDNLNAAIGEQLSLGDDHQQFIDSMVEAAAISSKGMGVDYASNIQKFVFGGSISSGVHQAGFTFNRGEATLPRGGYGAQLSLMAGLNLGMGGEEPGVFDRMRLYVNGMSMKLPSNRDLGGRMTNGGAHLQIKLVEGPDGKIVEWGGLDLTSGFEYTAYTLELRQGGLPIEAPIEGSGGSSMNWDATGEYAISSDIMSVPVEVSTNLRIFVVTAYLGGAYDYNQGVGSSRASLSGPIDGKIALPDGTTYDGELGQASITSAANGSSVPHVARLFVGAQVNVLVLKGFAHLNVEPLNGAIGGHLGLRVAL